MFEGAVMDAQGWLDAVPEDPSPLDDEQLQAGFAELNRAWEAVGAKRLRWLAELERRAAYRRDGHLSAATWLSERFGVAAGAAKREVMTATALQAMPAVQRALAAGEVSSSAVGALVSAYREHPEAFAEEEAAIVEQALSRPADELRRMLAEWSTGLDADGGAERVERLREQRHLSACPTGSGMVRVSGMLDPESGEVFLSAMQAGVDAEVRTGGGRDLRTGGQRRADALTAMAQRYLDSDERPSVGGERPNLTLTMDLASLRAARGTGRLDHVGPVPASVARRIACDSSVMRVVIDSASVPLDLGRRTAVVPASLRRAVVVRDGQCRFPGCGRPHAWCDAHHVVHWADGGETSLSNLVLLCRPHHRLVHTGEFTLAMDGGSPRFRRADGSVLEDRAPP